MPSERLTVKLLNVQVLRAYGALAVAFYHTGFSMGIGLGLPIGSFGVSIFFVISGFIMAMICEKNPQEFLSRRIARIVPLYWLLTGLVFLIGNFRPALLGATTVDSISLLKSLFFVPYLTHGTYFPILFLGWSLNYEMYFYLLIAGALVVNKRYAPLIASAAMITVLLALRALNAGGAAAFYAHPITLEFALGILCYYFFRKLSAERVRDHREFIVCGTALAGLTMIATAVNLIGPANAVIVGCTSTIMVLGAVLLDKGGVSVRWPALILLGDASYVIYLIHPYCEEGLNKIVARAFPTFSTKTWVGMPLALIVTMVVSIFLYRYLDKPLHLFFLKLLTRSKQPRNISTAVPSSIERPGEAAQAEDSSHATFAEEFSLKRKTL
jgi:exopolysaccharide production protein ExoZ